MGFAIVCVLIILDIVAGVLKSVYLGKLDSTELRKGLCHKGAEILALVVAGLIQYFIESIPVYSAVVIYLCFTELLSILENLCEVNSDLAKIFKPYFEKLKNKKEDNSKNDDTDDNG